MRTFSRSGGVVLMAMMVGSLLLASCSAAPTSPVTSVTDTKPYGRLTIAANFYVGAIVDPATKTLGGSGAFRNIGAPVFDSLVELTPEGQPRPGLAERWEIAPDGMTHTFYIRKGVKFHDGTDLTGADVKFSVDSGLQDLAASSYTSWRARLASVDLKDDYTVVFRMKEAQFDLLTGLGALEGTVGGVMPKKYIEEKGWDYFRRNPIGSGPWKVVSYEPNNRLELEALESHWRAVPKFQYLTVLNIKEEATKVAMLRTGEAGIGMEMSPDSVAGLKAAGLRVSSYYGSAQWYAALRWDLENPQKYAISDLRARKALSLAVSRQEIADKIFGGFAQPQAVAWVPTTAYFFDPAVLKADPYDPEQAKKLLVEAGYANGFPITLWDLGGGGIHSTANLALVGFWRKIGVAADLVPMDYGVASRRFGAPTPEPFNYSLSYLSSGGVFGSEKIATFYRSTTSFRNNNNPTLDALVDKIPKTADPAEKKRTALEAALLAKNGYSIISGVDADTIYAVGPIVGGATPIKGLVGLSPSYETISHAK